MHRATKLFWGELAGKPKPREGKINKTTGHRELGKSGLGDWRCVVLWYVRRMKTKELIECLKELAGTAEVYAEVCIDDGGGGLLPITRPRMASPEEKVKAGRDPNGLIVVIPLETGLARPNLP